MFNLEINELNKLADSLEVEHVEIYCVSPYTSTFKSINALDLFNNFEKRIYINRASNSSFMEHFSEEMKTIKEGSLVRSEDLRFSIQIFNYENKREKFTISVNRDLKSGYLNGKPVVFGQNFPSFLNKTLSICF